MSIKFSHSSETATLELRRRLQADERLRSSVSDHQPLRQFVRSKLGGVADIVVTVNSVDRLSAAAEAALASKVSYTVIASGTGTLVSDVGFPGLVIINKSSAIRYVEGTSQVVADAGVINDTLLNLSAGRGLGGLEFLAAIPGTVGGALLTNAGYRGKMLRPFVREATIALPTAGKFVTHKLTGQELDHLANHFLAEPIPRPVLLSVTLQFARITQEEIIRRLASIRKSRKELVGKSAIAYYLGELPEDFLHQQWKELNKYLPYCHLAKSSANALFIDRPEKLTAMQLKDFIHGIKNAAKAAGLVTNERIEYLGYWPTKEEDSQTPRSTNTESF